MWLTQHSNVRVMVDDGPETVLQGTELPEGGGRRFRSKPGGTISVLLVTDDPASLSFFSLGVAEACRTVADCSTHGTCDTKKGECRCESNYGGANCETFVSSPYFPGSQLVTVDWGKQLNEWKGKADQRWVLCYSSFTNDSGTPVVWHQLCDPHTNTLSVAHAEGTNHTFGGFVGLNLLPFRTILSCLLPVTNTSVVLLLHVVCFLRRQAERFPPYK
eukprot:COSAG02_NODE_751_length_17653_cov_172.765011_10_plen_217_part_00